MTEYERKSLYLQCLQTSMMNIDLAMKYGSKHKKVREFNNIVSEQVDFITDRLGEFNKEDDNE